MEYQGILDPLNEEHLFALHYVYVPRINQVLDVVREGWNHHGVRTVHNLSPYQMFAAGALQLRFSGLSAVDFFDNVDATYGVDEDETIAVNEDAGVSIPESRITMPRTDFQSLQEQVNPLAPSDNYGIELYYE